MGGAGGGRFVREYKDFLNDLQYESNRRDLEYWRIGWIKAMQGGRVNSAYSSK